VAAGQQHDRIAVGRSARRHLGTDVAGGARLVLDDELLAQSGAQPLRRLACHDIGRAAGNVRHDETHRPVGIGRLRLGCANGANPERREKHDKE
jgi:hypothetical protein